MSTISYAIRRNLTIGAAVLLSLVFSTPVFATGDTEQENLNPPRDRDSPATREESEDEVVGGSTILLRPIQISMTYAGGYQRTLNRGNEAFREADWHFGKIEALYRLGNVGDENAFSVQIGLTIGGAFIGHYNGSRGPDANQDSGDNRFNSNFYNLRVGGKVFLSDLSGSADDPAFWDASAEIWGGYTYERGRVGHNDPFPYRSKQTTLTLGARGHFGFIYPLYGLWTREQWTRIRGNRADQVIAGFAPRLDFIGEVEKAFSVNRRTTVTRAGGRDRQSPFTFSGEIRFHAYRWVNETPDIDKEWLWEIDLVMIGYVEGARRYGFAQVRNDHTSLRLGGGGGLYFTINRSAYINADGIVMQGNRGSDEVLGQFRLAVTIVF